MHPNWVPTADEIEEGDGRRRAFKCVFAETVPEARILRCLRLRGLRIAYFLEHGSGNRKAETRVGIAFGPALQAMADAAGICGRFHHRLDGSSRHQFLEYEARGIDHKVGAVRAGEMLRLVEGLAPLRESRGKGRVIDLCG